MIGSDDVLACFIAGNVFTWDDWFRLETLDDSLQPTIDMLLNLSIFMWFGAVCPWHSFVSNNVIPIYRLIPLGILVLLLRRLPVVLAMHKKIHQIEELKQAIFVGFFGPIGVSAIFYLYVSREFLRQVTVNGMVREDAARLAEIMDVVIWFLAICSIVVHGLSIPLGKLGFYLPRTISTAISSERVSATTTRERADPSEPAPLHLRQHEQEAENRLKHFFRRSRSNTSDGGRTTSSSIRPIVHVGRHIRNDLANAAPQENETKKKSISGPTDARLIGRALNGMPLNAGLAVPRADGPREAQTQNSPGLPMSWQRSIVFADEGRSVVATPKTESPKTESPKTESPNDNE